jgi:hypothetical protein
VQADQDGALDVVQERTRQRALDAYRVVDSLPEEVYDDIVNIAAMVCGTPIALVSLLDRDRQWFKARTGLAATGTARDVAVCDHAIRHKDDLFEVEDLSQDARFAANPLVTGDLHMRFYAGMPLVTPDGQPIGTVCVIDSQPRELDDTQRDALRALARITMALIDDCGQRRKQVQQAVHAASIQVTPDATRPRGFVAAIVELQDHAGVVDRIGEEAAEAILQSLEQALGRMLPSEQPGAVHRNPGSPECTLVFQDVQDETLLRRIGDLVASHAQASGVGILLGGAASHAPDEAMEEVFLRADDALSLAKDAAKA